MKEISASELNVRLSAAQIPIILDVREELEFFTFNLGGINIPLKKITGGDAISFDKEAEVIVVCQRGIRSRTACKILNRLGYKNVKNLTGGLTALQKINY